MTTGKTRLWLITLACAAGFIAAAIAMAGRIKDFNRTRHFAQYHAEPITARQVNLVGFPRLTIADAPSSPDQPARSGESFFKVSYGGDGDTPAAVKYVPVRRPAGFDIPTLGIYDEWAKLLAVNEVARNAEGDPVAKPGTERLLLVVRRTPEGYDPATWGSVRRTEWVFDFHTFTPDGKIKTETRRWPMAGEHREASFQERAASANPADPMGAHLKALAAIEPIEERSLEFFAAMHVIPKLNVPKHKFTDTALSPKVLGWTLPVSMLCGLAFSIAFFFAVAPSRISRGRSPPQPQ